MYDQLMLASDFIRRGQYDDARRLLVTIDHPKAREWLRRLDAMEGRPGIGAQEVHVHVHSAPPPASYAANAFPSFDPAYAAAAPAPAAVPAPIPDKPVTPLSLLFAVLGAIAGTLVGSVIYALAAVVLFALVGETYGIFAFVVGGLTGMGAVRFSGGRRGTAIQITAAIIALVGIFFAYYLAQYAVFVVAYGGLDGIEQTLRLYPFFDTQTDNIVFDSMNTSASFVDLIFIGLAIYGAWWTAGRRNPTE